MHVADLLVLERDGKAVEKKSIRKVDASADNRTTKLPNPCM